MSQRDMTIEGLSRVELEPRLAADIRVGTPAALAEAQAIRIELAARVWQNVNPYA
jgi:hypothetical protein